MKEVLIFFTCWMILLLAFALISDGTFDIGREAKKLIEECEVTLPRNQTCQLVAVPVEEDDK